MTPKLTIVTHYYSSDPDQTDDYYSREVELDGTIIREYADAYHDGDRSAKQFAEGIAWALGLNAEDIVERGESDIVVA
jgi:hypothetical protein